MYVPRAFAENDPKPCRPRCSPPAARARDSGRVRPDRQPCSATAEPDEGPRHTLRPSGPCQSAVAGAGRRGRSAGDFCRGTGLYQPGVLPQQSRTRQSGAYLELPGRPCLWPRRRVRRSRPLAGIGQPAEQRHEANRPEPWAVSDAPSEYIDSMLKAIVGFSLPISRLIRQAQAQPKPQRC
jgi:transcriptional regulator